MRCRMVAAAGSGERGSSVHDGIAASLAVAPALIPPQLPLLRLELVFVMDEPIVLPPFRGNLWRGILGPALKRIDEGLLPGVSTGDLPQGTLYDTFFATRPPAE